MTNTIQAKRKESAKLRISPARRQFLIDLIVHDIELKDLGYSPEWRVALMKRFVKTFGGQ
jgi:hypothetical protein